MLRLEFRAEIIHWRGPAPFYFVPVPLAHAADIRAAAKFVSYGWGMIPVEATLNGAAFTTSLFPKDESYLLPLKAAVRKTTGVTVGDEVAIVISIGLDPS